ncbi:MAG: primosomal protein N' [Porphyromonadaceae bacterium]|nr:primosomal protein N' [Porphyromonadaceae bacterium]
MYQFADVILPLPLTKYFTYRIPTKWQESLVVGSRVIVPFGYKHFYTAIVAHLHNEVPSAYEVKEILTLLDNYPILRPLQLRFWEWMADYYLCSVGDVFKAAVPTGLKIESETQIAAVPDFIEKNDAPLKEREAILWDILSRYTKMSVQELERESGLRNILPFVRSLMEQNAVVVSEELRYKYRPRTENYVRLSHIAVGEQEKVQELCEKLKPAKKQLQLLRCYLELSGFMQEPVLREVSRRELLEQAGLSPQILGVLMAKGVFENYTKEVSRFSADLSTPLPPHPFSVVQQKTYDAILNRFAEKEVVLLHGVTSSGKTEIYIHLIEAVLKKGEQVLYLVPEIALTAQLAARLQRVFGNRLVVYHSRFTDSERVEIWNKLLHDTAPQIVLGVRSSVFLPFCNLGLVIVDEEHEGSYKQQEPAPRYHARNAAIVLASMHGAKTLLGTATPAIESYYNAMSGKYGLVELPTRYEDISLPQILPVDMGDLRRKRRVSYESNLSPQLKLACEKALKENKQVILFQNRRGFAPMVECRLCAWTPRCPQCDVSLTYHKHSHLLMCHYCGHIENLPVCCPACGNESITIRGFGTERVEEEVKQVFPDYSVVRMDFDSTRNRRAYEQIISDFEQQKSRILVGTQMVTKGLDFDHVSVVGILNADTLLNYPDFRAHERAFQMMEQVAGRAGRKNQQGIVILQTAQPQHPVIGQVMRHDYAAMYASQITERQQFNYPPFTRLIYIYLKHRDEPFLDQAAQDYVQRLYPVFGQRVSMPHTPPVARIQMLYIRRIMIKVERAASLKKVREALRQVQENILSDVRFRSLMVYYDVDPL